MIQKIVTGKGFRGVLEYVTGKDQAECVASNMAGRNARELASEFGAFRALRPELGNAVQHISLSLHDQDRGKLDGRWQDVVERHLDALGFKGCPYVAFRHKGEDLHDHVHIIASRIRTDGSVVSDSWNWKRGERHLQDLRKEFGLVEVPSSNEVEVSQPTSGELGLMVRTEEPTVKLRVQELAVELSADRPSVATFVRRMEAAGVAVVANVQSTGRVAGLSFCLDGVAMKASDLGKGFSWGKLVDPAKGRLTYVEDRDLEALRAATERATRVQPDGAGRQDHRSVGDPAHGAGDLGEHEGLRRQSGDGLGAAGEVHGHPDRGDQVHFEGDRLPVEGGPRRGGEGRAGVGEDAGRVAGRTQEVGTALREEHGGIDSGGAHGDRGAEHSGGEDQPARRDAVDRDEPPRDTAVHRVVSLAEAAGPVRHRREDGDHVSGRSEGGVQLSDPTARQVAAQLQAFGTDRFEVGILAPKDAEGVKGLGIRQWTAAEVQKNLGWLKRQNVLGLDIYIRPMLDANGKHLGLVFVDDLNAAGVERMKRDGFPIAVPIESSPGRYHGWVRVSAEPIPKEVATKAAQELARRYGGDPQSADWRHFGRLAGTTNRKPKYRNPKGLQPFAKLGAVAAGVAPRGPELVALARQHVAADEASKVRAARIATRVDTIRQSASVVPRDADTHYRRHAARLESSCVREGQIDWSRVDYGCAAELYKSGYDPKEIEGAIHRNSPAIEQRHADPADYAQRTVQSVMANPDVQAGRAAHAAPSRGGRAPGGGGPPPKPMPRAPEVGKRVTWADGETSRKL